MDHFTYRNARLHAEQVALDTIAEAVGTPFYCYSTATFERHYTVFADAVADALDNAPTTICYAVKSNGNIAVLATLARLGAGADVVSVGELKRALAAGIPASKIVFSGVGKTTAEMATALSAGIMQINVESVPELETLSALAQSMGMTAPVALRINPDVDARTHAKISTGKLENKFGIEWTRAHKVAGMAAQLPGIDLVGIAAHIGSQLVELDPFHAAFERLGDLVAMLRADGHDIRTLDLGGGLGIPYQGTPPPSPADYAAVVKKTVAGIGCRLIFEPGRVIAGNAGVLVSGVTYVKQGATRTFVILDAAMNDLVRPTMYQAHHDIIALAQPAEDAPYQPADVVGPICETGDTFATARPMPPLATGDRVAFRSAGAYSASMSSTYNARPLIPEVLVNGDQFAVIRDRVPVETQMSYEHIPDWLGADDPK